MITIERYHDISMGHRVVGHENKCRHLHGHNYRIHFTCTASGLDALGRIVDFGVLKSLLCMWLEEHWDHRLMLWEEDPLLPELERIAPEDIVKVPFNPTAEQMAEYLLGEIAPRQLEGTGVAVIGVRIEETRKCSATARLDALPSLANE